MNRQGKIRKGMLIGSVAFSLASLSSPVMAFTPEPVQERPAEVQKQQQPVQIAPPQVVQPQVVQPQAGPAGAPQGYFVQPFSLNNGSGTEVTIPGVGSVGTLPKLDFGLELLYAPQANIQSPLQDQRTPDNDVQIKGTLKHKF